MTSDPRHTSRPFTVAVCTACDAEPQCALMPRLRELIRACPHGMLVATGCLLGTITCATRSSAHGQMLLLQPCTADRVPTASLQWIGPIRTEADAEAACEWISIGSWDYATLPPALRADLHLSRSSRRN